MARRSGWARLGIAIGILIALALIAHFAGGSIMDWVGKLHGR